MFGERLKVGMIEVAFDQELYSLRALRICTLIIFSSVLQQGLALACVPILLELILWLLVLAHPVVTRFVLMKK